MGLLSALFRRGGKAAAMAADEPVTRLPVNFTREIGQNAMPMAPPAPFRNSLRGGSQDLAEAARMIRREDWPQFMALISAGMGAAEAIEAIQRKNGPAPEHGAVY